MISAQRNKYLETSIQTATPAQLLIMLIDGAIRFCKQGIEAIREKDYAKANESLGRAQSIVNELNITLDRNVEISQSLALLYDYFNRRLIEANVSKKIEPAEEVLGYLIDLKETWVQAALIVKQQTVPK